MKAFVLAGFLVMSLVFLEGNCNPANGLNLRKPYSVGLTEPESALGGILQKSSLEEEGALCADIEADLVSTFLAVVQSLAEAVFNYLGGNIVGLVGNIGQIVQSILLYGLCELL